MRQEVQTPWHMGRHEPGKKTYPGASRQGGNKFNNAPGTISWRKFVHYWHKNFCLDILAYMIYVNNYNSGIYLVFKIATNQISGTYFLAFIHTFLAFKKCQQCTIFFFFFFFFFFLGCGFKTNLKVNCHLFIP
jgi:hypothetical protein